MPPVLYTFGGSVWAAAPELAVRELGYGPNEIEKKVVDLIKGENFKPEFLQINPKGTLPTLQADGKTYTNTTDVVAYLVQNAPPDGNKSARTQDKAFIEEIHQERIDPNFAMLLARNDEELTAKTKSIPQLFLANRQDALHRISITPDAEAFSEFYASKIASNGALLNIYLGQVPATDKQVFFQESQTHFANVASYILETLPQRLSAGTEFIDGNVPGETDFHVAAWLARIASTSGATDSARGIEALTKAFGKDIPSKVQTYWDAWSSRASWKEVYAEGLH